MSTAETGLPAELDSPAGKLVYFALATDDGCAVDDLRRRLDMKRVDVYGILGTLQSRGLVERVGGDTYRVAE